MPTSAQPVNISRPNSSSSFPLQPNKNSDQLAGSVRPHSHSQRCSSSSRRKIPGTLFVCLTLVVVRTVPGYEQSSRVFFDVWLACLRAFFIVKIKAFRKFSVHVALQPSCLPWRHFDTNFRQFPQRYHSHKVQFRYAAAGLHMQSLVRYCNCASGQFQSRFLKPKIHVMLSQLAQVVDQHVINLQVAYDDLNA